jgi:hypothetical protein
VLQKLLQAELWLADLRVPARARTSSARYATQTLSGGGGAGFEAMHYEHGQQRGQQLGQVEKKNLIGPRRAAGELRVGEGHGDEMNAVQVEQQLSPRRSALCIRKARSGQEPK